MKLLWTFLAAGLGLTMMLSWFGIGFTLIAWGWFESRDLWHLFHSIAIYVGILLVALMMFLVADKFIEG